MGPINFKILRFSIAFLCGIITAHYLEIPFSLIISFTSIIGVLFLIFYISARHQIYQQSYFGICCYLLLFFFGSLAFQLKLPKNRPNYFSNVVVSEKDFIKIELKEELKPTTQQRFIGEAKAVISAKKDNNQAQTVFGKILVSAPFEDSLSIGQTLYTPATYQSIPGAFNPHQFDYSDYLKFQGINYQIRLFSDTFFIGTAPGSFFLTGVRSSLLKKLAKAGFKEDELAVIQALILGERSSISSSLYQKYAAAGAIHILAVSGLHVGIILLLLNFLLRPLRHFKILKLILTLIGIWSFAVLTGLSASVVRASFMFSFIAFGLQMHRQVNLLNTLLVAFFVLMIVNPFYIFQVGFQLSFAAVLSIALFQPKFNQLWFPSNRIIRFFYQTITVSIAAQISTLPLSLYYFHQFPGLFLLTNVVILPGLGILLITGILILILSILNILPEEITLYYSILVEKLNGFVEWIASQEHFIIQNIHIPLVAAFLLFGLIFVLFLLIQFKQKPYIYWMLGFIILLQLCFLYDKEEHHSAKVFILNKPGSSLIAEKQSEKLRIHASHLQDSNWSYLQDFKIQEGINTTEVQQLEMLYSLKQKRILIIDSTAVFDLEGIQPDILVLSNSPHINLERAIEVLKPGMIVADASNYAHAVARWEETCLNKKIPFHYTAKKGSFNY